MKIKKNLPLNRERKFQGVKRIILKNFDGRTWYKDLNLGDKYHKLWKKKLYNYGPGKNRRLVHETDTRDTVCTMFVPPSIDSKLTEKIISVEEKLKDKFEWKVKVLEQSGTPLAMSFLPRFELLHGCPRGGTCLVSECKGLKCAPRRVVYSAVCKDCKKSGNAEMSTYIGETCRPLRERVLEHRRSLTNADPRSFQLAHWMESHGTGVTLPEFEFKVIASYEDALRRQLCEGLHILQSGTLNRKLEFNNNVISRLEVPDSNIYQESWLRERLDDRSSYRSKINSFIGVMSSILNDWPYNKYNKKKMQEEQGPIDSLHCYRFSNYTPMEGKRKQLDYESSTPTSGRREVVLIPLEDSPIEGIAPALREGNRSGGDSNVSTGSDVVSTQKKKAGVSNELDGTAITPAKDLSSGTFGSRLFWGADNLSSAGVGVVQELAGESLAQVPTTATPDRNWFAKREGIDNMVQEEYPMEVVEQEKKPPLIIGRSASSTLLKEKGCGVTSSPKRQLPALPGTPLKKHRVYNEAHESASPNLKRIKGQRKKGENKNIDVRKESILKPKPTGVNSNKYNGGKNLITNQPRIDAVFKKMNNGVGEKEQGKGRERDGVNDSDKA